VLGSVIRGSAAEKAGLKRGDRVVNVAGDAVNTWKDLDIAFGIRRPDRDIPVTFTRDGQTQTTTVRPSADGKFEVADLGGIGMLPDVNPVITQVIEGDRAEKAGLKAGDIVLAVNGERMATRLQLIDVISRSGGKTIQLTVRRGAQEITVSGTPEQRGARGMMGFYISEPTKSFKPGPFEAVKLSVEHNIESSGIIFRTLAGLFTGETSVRQLQGPVGIAQLSGESAQEGFITLLSLMAMLSINLGILNLMPVPVLDGGHILIMALEGIARRDFSMQVKEKMLLAGFVVLMMLMVTVIYNDLTRISWIERLMPWRN
jgi:regulator of sigma E protease